MTPPVRAPAWSLSRSAIGLWVTEGVLSSLGIAIAAALFAVFVPDDAGGPVPLLRWLVPIAALLYAVVTIGVRPWFRFRVHRWEVTADAVEFIDEVPKTSVGKFSKKDLRAKFAEYELPS